MLSLRLVLKIITKLTEKITKKAGKILLWILGIFIAFDLLIVTLVFIPPIQNAIVRKVSTILTEKWESEISMQKIYLSPSLKLTVKGFVIKDDRDTPMIAVEKLKARIRNIEFKPFKLCFKSVLFENADIALTKYRGEEQVNIAKWGRKISNPDRKTQFMLKADKLTMKNSRFALINEENRAHNGTSTEMDFSFLELKDLNFEAIDFLVDRDDISGYFTNLAFCQYTGFNLQKAKAFFRINEKGLIFSNATLITDHSQLYLDLFFEYPNWNGYSSFTDSVIIKANVKPSWFDLRDVGCWVNSLRGMDNQIFLAVNLTGSINNMNLQDLRLHYKQHNTIKGNLHLTNITDIKNAFLDVDFKDSKVRLSELTSFLLPKGKRVELPEQVMNIGNVALNGQFQGKLTHFITNWDFSTDVGNLALNLQVKDKKNMLYYEGDIHSNGIDIGKIIKQQPLLGKTALKIHIDGKTKTNELFASSETQIKGNISRFDFFDYSVNNITFDGNLTNQLYKGSVESLDTNLNFKIDGSIDFANILPIYKIQMKLKRFIPNEIVRNLPPVDSATAKGLDKFIYLAQENPTFEFGFSSLELSLHGKTVYDINGFFGLDNIYYKNEDKKLEGERIRITVINTPARIHKYVLASSFFNANLNTNCSFPEMIDNLKDIAYLYFGDILPERKTGTTSKNSIEQEQYFSLQVETFQTRNLFAILLPEFTIAPRSTLNISFSNRNSDFMELSTSRIRWGDKLRVSNLKLSAKDASTSALQIKILADSVIIPQKKSDFAFSGIDFSTNYLDNKLFYSLHWHNPHISQLASFLSGTVDLSDKTDILFHIANSSLNLQENLWAFNEDHLIHFRKKQINFENVVLKSGKSQLQIEGIFSFEKKDDLNISVLDVELEQLNRFIQNMNVNFGGNISAKIKLGQWTNQRMITGKLLIDDFVLNNEKLGHLFLGLAVSGLGEMGFSGGLFERTTTFKSSVIEQYSLRDYNQENTKIAKLNGAFLFDKKSLEVKADIDTLKIGFLSPFLSSFSHVFKGHAGGKLTFVLNPDSLYFDGTVTVKQGELGIAPLSTVYTLTNQDIHFNRKGIIFDNMILQDQRGNTAKLNGHVHHQRFNDFKINLAIETDRIMAMNIPKQSDVYFYGLGFVAGGVSIIGNTEKLTFRGNNLRTLQGTKLYLPLTFASRVSETEGIIFKIDESHQIAKKFAMQEKSTTIMEFDFVFNVNRDAEVQIDLDPSIGGTLNAQLDGPLRLYYNSESALDLSGRLSIVSGKFALSLADVLLNVNLDLVPDGTISFNGGIDNSVLDIKTVHKTNTSLKDIIPDASIRRVPVNAYLNLKGGLMTPLIGFSFELPDATTEDNARLNSMLNVNDQANAARQFFSLLLSSRFMPNSDQMLGGNFAGDMGTDMLASILNNLLFHRIKYVDLGVNYRQGGGDANQEFSFNTSFSAWKNRIVVGTSLGYVDNKINNESYNKILGNANIDLLLTESGNWRLKAFYTTNNADNYDMLQQTAWGVAGVGIAYKQDFNQVKDLKGVIKRKKKKE